MTEIFLVTHSFSVRRALLSFLVIAFSLICACFSVTPTILSPVSPGLPSFTGTYMVFVLIICDRIESSTLDLDFIWLDVFLHSVSLYVLIYYLIIMMYIRPIFVPFWKWAENKLISPCTKNSSTFWRMSGADSFSWVILLGLYILVIWPKTFNVFIPRAFTSFRVYYLYILPPFMDPCISRTISEFPYSDLTILIGFYNQYFLSGQIFYENFIPISLWFSGQWLFFSEFLLNLTLCNGLQVLLLLYFLKVWFR